MKHLIEFRHHQPSAKTETLSNFLAAGIVLGIICMVYFFKIGIAIVVCSVILNILQTIFSDSRKNAKGIFIFHENSFSFRSGGKEKNINYEDIISITREFYDETVQTANITHTRPNGNQYRISSKGQNEIILRVAPQEEKSYCREMEKFNKKAYGINRFGFHLTSKMPDITAKMQSMEGQEPLPGYTLEKAISMLLQESKITLTDNTEVE